MWIMRDIFIEEESETPLNLGTFQRSSLDHAPGVAEDIFGKDIPYLIETHMGFKPHCINAVIYI